MKIGRPQHNEAEMNYDNKKARIFTRPCQNRAFYLFWTWTRERAVFQSLLRRTLNALFARSSLKTASDVSGERVNCRRRSEMWRDNNGQFARSPTSHARENPKWENCNVTRVRNATDLRCDFDESAACRQQRVKASHKTFLFKLCKCSLCYICG